jgi:hypothetical protein
MLIFIVKDNCDKSSSPIFSTVNAWKLLHKMGHYRTGHALIEGRFCY